MVIYSGSMCLAGLLSITFFYQQTYVMVMYAIRFSFDTNLELHACSHFHLTLF
jgi:hypothetical protein